MTASQAIQEIQSAAWQGGQPGLSRVTALLEALGRPDRNLRFIHIAGTNGKGSTAAMLSSNLEQAGYRTGLYTSPYLRHFSERMRVNGQPISEEDLADWAERVIPLARALPESPTQFELLTCLALCWFAQQTCDIVVLETGLGGRLDATNVIEAPEICVLTNIGLDHTRELGDTLTQIAKEKAGILKPGVPAVLYPVPQEADTVVEAACQRLGCPLIRPRPQDLLVHGDSLEGQDFNYPPFRDLHLSLLGGHQRNNAATVLETVLQLRRQGWNIPEEAVRSGLSAARWPGRFQLLRRAPCFVLDGGHNPQCAQALAVNLGQYFPGKKIHFLLGVLSDKDWTGVMDLLAPLAASFTAVSPNSPRALPARELGAYLERYGLPVTVCDSPAQGAAHLLSDLGKDEIVCCFGSLYLAGEILDLFPSA